MSPARARDVAEIRRGYRRRTLVRRAATPVPCVGLCAIVVEAGT